MSFLLCLPGGLNFAYWRLCVSREEIFPNVDFRFYCWEEIFANLRQFSLWYFTFGTATHKSSDKGFRIFFAFCLCSLSNKSLKSAITTQSYTAYGNTKKWIKFLRIFFFWRKIIFANRRIIRENKTPAKTSCKWYYVLWLYMKHQPRQISSPKCCKKWEDVCLVASVYWFYINTSQAQTKRRKWKDFVFSVPRSTMYLSCVIRESITRDKSWNTIMNIWVWTFNFFGNTKIKKKF